MKKIKFIKQNCSIYLLVKMLSKIRHSFTLFFVYSIAYTYSNRETIFLIRNSEYEKIYL